MDEESTVCTLRHFIQWMVVRHAFSPSESGGWVPVNRVSILLLATKLQFVRKAF